MKVGIVMDTAFDALGINRYAQELAIRMAKSEAVEELVLIHSRDQTKLPLFEGQSKVRELLIPFPKRRFSREIRQLFILPFKLRQQKLDIVHDVHHFAPFLFDTNRYGKIITVHDLMPYLLRNIYPWQQRLSFFIRYRFILPLILKRADAITANSNSTKTDFVRHLKVSPDKIEVIYHGISDNYHLLDDSERIARLKHKYQLDFPFVLGEANAHPCANIGTLIEGFKILKRSKPEESPNLKETRLVFFGHYTPNHILTDGEMGLQRDIVFLGYVPEEDLPTLYASATLFVHPSLYEGFGVPPLEAMACGTPVVVSNTGALPEVVGNAGILFDPRDVKTLVQAMREVLTREELRQKLIGAGLERVKKFTFEETTRKTLEMYQRVFESKRHRK